jgi:uncharacterized protein YuzE
MTNAKTSAVVLTEDEDGSAYLKLGSEKVVRTKRISDKINVDFNMHGEVVGIEFLFYSLTHAALIGKGNDND